MPYRSGDGRSPSPTPVTVVRHVLCLLIDPAAARGIPAGARGYCSACLHPRPLRGFVQLGRYQLCNTCAIEYAVARSVGEPVSAGQFVRDKQFGEADRYALPAAAHTRHEQARRLPLPARRDARPAAHEERGPWIPPRWVCG